MRRRIRGPNLMALALPILVGSYFAYHRLVHQPTLPEGLIQANGRIEGDHMTVSSKFSGRIQTVSVQEGDWVKAGQTLIALDDTQVRTRVTQAEKAVETLQARLEALRIDLEVLRLMMFLSPLQYYINASFGILLKGADLSLRWDSVLGI
ncbi:MAG TPA: hypothetical protein DCE18_04780, partial [Syntrophobacteraceae bacterium]|nr:hypothetical protein [Syntrophobacteraceae bacterium]